MIAGTLSVQLLALLSGICTTVYRLSREDSRIREVPMLTRALMLALLGGCAIGARSVRPGTPSADVAMQFEKAFPGSIQVSEDAPSPVVQFCPENTCEAFTARENASVEDLKDFAFLFVYYFSDYRVLETWRSREEPKVLATRILAKRRAEACVPGGGKELARCILREMARSQGIRVEGIRYDEGARSVVPMALP